MKKHTLVFILASVLSFHSLSAQAIVIDLFEWAFNIDGTFYSSFTDALPVDGTLDASGLGTLSTEFTDPGSHTFIAYFDFEITETGNTFFNEFGLTDGTRDSGQSWEIDEPGFGGRIGDIYDNVMAGTLDNTNEITSSFLDDVAFAIGWDFTLAVGETANIVMELTDTIDGSVFSIEQRDFNSPVSVFYDSTLGIVPPSTTVPEPPSLALFSIGLLGFGIVSFRRFVNSRKAECKLLAVS